jgi:hypothetical protein
VAHADVLPLPVLEEEEVVVDDKVATAVWDCVSEARADEVPMPVPEEEVVAEEVLEGASVVRAVALPKPVLEEEDVVIDDEDATAVRDSEACAVLVALPEAVAVAVAGAVAAGDTLEAVREAAALGVGVAVDRQGMDANGENVYGIGSDCTEGSTTLVTTRRDPSKNVTVAPSARNAQAVPVTSSLRT